MFSRTDNKISEKPNRQDRVQRGTRGHDAQAPAHDGIWLGLRTKSDEWIIGTPNDVIKAKTVRRLAEDQRWCVEEVLNTQGIPSNPVPGAGGGYIRIEANGTKHAERGEGEHAPAQEREKCDTRTTVAAPTKQGGECT